MNATRTATRTNVMQVLAALVALSFAVALWSTQARADTTPFLGTYTGSAEVIALDGTKIPRDMSVEISKTKDGFRVQWTSVTYRQDG